jgi:photosystem II stability/assembly factor-like uncharacterized protein
MRRFALLCIAAMLCIGAAPSNPFADLKFRNVGPQVSGGRLGAVAGTDADSSLYYAGAAGGGVWKTTNAGQSWTPVFDKEPAQSIGAIAIDPSNVNVVWVGTGEGAPRNDVIQGDGVYRTMNGGKTWQRMLPLQNALTARILIDPRDSNTVLVGVLGDPFADNVDRGIYRTTDGGKTWKKTLYVSPRTGVADMDATAKAPGVVYAGMWDYRRTGWSSNSGGPNGGLYKSTDFGATWQRLRGHGLPTGETGRIGVAIAPSNPQRVYALIESKQGLIWRSDDGGANWQMISKNTLIDERPFYYTHVFVDPTNQDHVWTLSVHVAVSDNGGKTWRIGARGVHGDNHGMWISRDAKRIIEANDGGPSFSFDNGATWAMPHNLPIAQLYHVGFDRERPYHLCAPLQDNGVWCAPNDGLTGRGISASQWHAMGGGDGTMVMPDPTDANIVWFTSGGGNSQGELSYVDLRSGLTQVAQPYLRDQNVVDPKDLKYRFNWEEPFAFDPFHPHRMYVGGNVLFETADRGNHWKAISRDLTRNDRAHEVITGGITLDGTGAETSDTILAIEPSKARAGEIWVGTDDGLVQLTTDAGKHWRNVSPRVATPWGRFSSLSAPPHDAATLYAVYDAHMAGDRAPHLYVTHDYGAHWNDLAQGLPHIEVRSVRVDPRNPRVVYAGLENGLYVSIDGGAHWRNFNLNMPAVSVRDIQVQPDADDLLLATHGRAVYVFDDLAPLQQWQGGASPRLFAPRPAYQWNLHDYFATRVDGANPPYGAIVTYYLPRAEKNASADIVDVHGRTVRHFDAKDLTPDAGFNRVTWDTTEDKPVDWRFAPTWNQGIDSGAPVVPGTYTFVLHAGRTTLRAPIAVRQDPRTHFTAAELRAGYESLHELMTDFGRVNAMLNTLSTVLNEAPLRAKQADARGNTALALRLSNVAAKATDLLLTITQNPTNDQDNDFLTDILRERLQTEIGYATSNFGPVPHAQEQQIAELHALTGERERAVQSFEATLRGIDAELRAAKLPALTTLTKQPPVYNPGAGGERRGADL